MDIVPVIQADRVLWHVLLGMPEANRARRLQGLPIVEPLALLAAHRIAGQAELREALHQYLEDEAIARSINGGKKLPRPYPPQDGGSL